MSLNVALHRRPPQKGFTLIEVLAALVIVSIGMLAVINAVSQTASTSAYLREKTVAHWVAMNRLTEARLQPAPPKIDRSSDEVEMAGRRWKWTMDVTQTPVESVRRIDIRVRPIEADEKSSMATVTGFYGAAIAPPGSTSISWMGSPEGGQGPGGDQDDGEQEQDQDQDQDRERDRDNGGDNEIEPGNGTDPIEDGGSPDGSREEE